MTLSSFQLIPPVVSKPVRMLMLTWASIGLVTILYQLLGGVASSTLSSGPNHFEVIFSFLLIFGSTSINISTLSWPRQTTTWKLEVLGWPPAIAAWVLFLVAAITDSTPAPYPIIFGFGFITFSIYRLIELLLCMRVSRGQWEAIQNGKGNA